MAGRILKWAAMAAALVYLSCAAPREGIKPRSELDTPEAAYRQGKGLLEEGRYDAAIGKFDRSIKLAQYLRQDFAPGYEGLAMAYLGKGALQLAEKNIEQALDIDDDYSDAYVGRGRIYDAQGRYEDAIGEFKQALKKDKGNTAAYFYMGKTYEEVDELKKAERAYERALEIEPGYAKADRALESLQRITRAVAGMPPEYREIAKKEAITRADVAALFVNELPLDRIFRKALAEREEAFEAPPSWREPGEAEAAEIAIPDIQDHWARVYIEKMTDLGIMEVYPDGMFRPDEMITRANFALLIQTILVEALNDPGLATKFIGNISAFPDVPSSHYAFNAISLVTTRGIMKARLDGTFGMMDPVPGWDALLALKTLKGQL